jgi:hypothetical protein
MKSTTNYVRSKSQFVIALMVPGRLLLLTMESPHNEPRIATAHSQITVKVKVKVTLRLAVYRQSVRLGVKPLETHDQIFFFG